MAKKSNTTKRAIKFLAVCKDRSVTKKILERAPDCVLKTICNAALNAEKGDIKIPKRERQLFAKHRGSIAKLSSKKLSLASKRRIIQSGGFFPVLIAIFSLLMDNFKAINFAFITLINNHKILPLALLKPSDSLFNK